jgi:endonuclease/exonuclease/phosphatase family metal-dependent hydrolase
VSGPGFLARLRRFTRGAPLNPADPQHLRVMTYNTHHGANRLGVLDIEAIAATIEACRPDVVALQEVDRHWGDRSARADQPAWYADRLGMSVHFVPTIVRSPARATEAPPEYGLALLSRFPLTAPEHQLYSSPAAGEPRGLQKVSLLVPGPHGAPRTLRVLNTHLSVRGNRMRTAQVAELLSYADPPSDPLTVVAGDFNAVRRSRALRQLRSTYRDAWDAGRGSPATMLGRRIDYLWMSHHLRPVQTVVVRSRASDHFPVVSDLTWS